MAEIRERVLERLDTRRLRRRTIRCLRDGYVYQMVLQHEYQHNETILQTLQLKTGAPYRAPRRTRAAASAPRLTIASAMVRFDGGRVDDRHGRSPRGLRQRAAAPRRRASRRSRSTSRR